MAGLTVPVPSRLATGPWWRLLLGATVGAAVLALPLGAGRVFSMYYVSLATEALVFIIFAIGYNIVAGYTGMVSFGHAMFFGGGAFAAALVVLHLTRAFWVAAAIALGYTALLAVVVGWLTLRTKGVYFAFLTLVFSQFFFLLSFNWDTVLGGDNGLPSIAPYTLAPLPIVVNTAQRAYYLALACAVVAFAVGRRVVTSPFGQVLVAIRENERRAGAIGYPVRYYKIKSLVISAVLSGLAGVMMVSLQGYVSPDLFHWVRSGEIILMVLLGGMGTLLGPVLGAAFWVIVGRVMTSLTGYWMIVMGVTYVLFVLFLPEGFVGLLQRWRVLTPSRPEIAVEGASPHA